MSFADLFNQKFDVFAEQYVVERSANKNNLTPETIDKIRRVIYHNSKSIVPEIFQNLDKIDDFVPNFGDEASKECFVQELCYIIFSQINFEFAIKHVSPLTEDDIKKKVQAFQDAKLSVPAIDFPKSHNPYYPFLTTFIIRQYAYDVPDRAHGKFEVEPGEVVLNCGACMGDSTIWLYQEGAAKVYSFEPMPSAYEFLQHNLKKFGYPLDLSFQLAVGEKEETLTFQEVMDHMGASSQLTEDELKKMQEKKPENVRLVEAKCVKLDDWLQANQVKPTYIKMDLEGAEPYALAGLKETISKLKPKLAICLYHRPSDMWTLPALIKSFNQDYKFYCKKGHYMAEFVLFAV